MGKLQKVYTKEFKEEAVRLVQSSGRPVAQIARELGISDSAIFGWQKQLAAKGPDAFPGTGHQSTLEEENRRLKRDLEIPRQERDILKKRPCRSATPMRMKILPKQPRDILSGRETR